MATLPPNDPRAPKVVRHEKVTHETVPATGVIVEKRTVARRSNAGAWIVGLCLLVLVFVLGYSLTDKEPEPNVTSVTVNNPTPRPTAVETRVVNNDVSSPPDVDVFVESAERDIVVLSRPDNAENQAEIAAIRQRMEELRRADAASAAAIRAEVEASMARLRASGTASTTTETGTVPATATTTTSATTVAPADASASTVGVDVETLGVLQKRVDDASAMVGQLQSTAAPTAAEQMTALQEQLAKVQGDMASLSTTTGQEQMDMLAALEAEVASLEEGVKAVPIR